MAAFERIKSGIDDLDKIVDNIRLGDNVVWQVLKLADFKYFTQPFAKQAIADGRNLIYFRFAGHEPILEPQSGLKLYKLNPNEGFESFTVAVHKIIEKEGKGAFYVFDSLSDLQVAWSTDLMMGNFFKITCPYLFELDTVAYFPVLRGEHSFEAIDRIRETTQLFFDVYEKSEVHFLYPLKVWNRYKPDMFLPWRFNGDYSSTAVTNGVDVSEYYGIVHREKLFKTEQNLDSYERFFSGVKNDYINGNFDNHTRQKICRSMMTRDEHMGKLINAHFSPEDYFFVKDRMIGTGTIGGKACGMLLACKIAEKNLPQYKERLEPHDSFYIGTDFFYSYLVENNLWKLRISQRSKNHYFEAGEEMRQKLLNGAFSESSRIQLRRLLDYFGQSPIIVRSSSFLEDGFGNAFAGKYQSVFCVNAVSPDARLEQLEKAIKAVYASTMDRSAIEYRIKRGLAGTDEQMALLIQRVSGTKFGSYFMPCAAGVGYSYSAYRSGSDIDPSAGFLRLVMGLGTRAVDRTDGDYPRLVNLDRPESSTLVRASDRHKYSQHKVDVLDFDKNELVETALHDLLPNLPQWYKNLVLEHDRETEALYRARGDRRDICFANCDRLVKNQAFIAMMKDLLHELQAVYNCPVDIEYTVNFRADGNFVVNLLQCRPLYVGKDGEMVKIPDTPESRQLFNISRSFLGNSTRRKIDVVVWIDAKAYFSHPYAQKPTVAAAVGEINKYYKDSQKVLMLVAPGRIGTSSPELGVPTSFSDISGFSVICEYSKKSTGYMPELSYGSHMFQDLVESDIFYAAILEEETTKLFNPALLDNAPNLFTRIAGGKEVESIIKVLDVTDLNLSLYADLNTEQAVCTME